MEIISLIIPFIALAILSVMIDKLTLVLEGVMHKIPRLPDQFEWWIAYVIVAILSFIVCWQGNFDLFAYLDIYFNYKWQGWLMTALVLSGGSAFVRTNFSMIEAIPAVLGGVTTTVKGFFKSSKSNQNSNTTPTQQHYDSNNYTDYNEGEALDLNLNSYNNESEEVTNSYSNSNRYSDDI